MNSTSPSSVPSPMNVSTPASALPSPSPVVAINSTTVPSPSSVTPAAVPSSSSVPPTPSPLAIPSPSVPSSAVVPSSSTPSVPSSNFPAISPSSVQAGSPFADDILLFLLVALLASVCLRWGCRTRTNKAAQQYNRIDDPFDVETELVGVKKQYIQEIPEPELPEENTV